MVQINKSKKAPIPIHIKSITLCAFILLSVQAILISTVYFNLNNKIESTVLDTFTNTSIEKVEQNILSNVEKVEQKIVTNVQNVEKKIISKFENIMPQKKANKVLDGETKRKMYRQLYLTGKQGNIDIETMVKLAAETEDLEEIVNITDLPTQADIFKMYGDKVMMEGEDTCKKFRELPFARRVIAPAGLFNTVSNRLNN